jgi:hypothetical protein
VVAVVVGQPEAVAQPDGQVRQQNADQIVASTSGEDLLVPGVVGEEADLGEYDGEERCDSQLPPGLADQHERGPPRGEQD